MSDLIKFNDLDKVKMMVSNRKQEWIELIKNAEINIHQKIELKNQAHTIDKYLQGKRDCESARDDLWEVSEWALKKIGEDLKKLKQEGVIRQGTRTDIVEKNDNVITLKDLNLTRDESSTAQARAEIPDEEYQATLDALKEKGKANASAVTKYANDKRKKENLQNENEKRKKTLTEEKKIQPKIYQMNAIDYLNKFENNSIDLLITDPPFSTDVDDIFSFANEWVTLALEKIKHSGRAYICIGAYPKEINTYLSILLNQNKFIVDNPLIWTYRNTLGVTPKMKYNLNYQMILHLYSENSKPLDNSITNEMFSVQDINAPDGRKGDRFFKWQKPDELCRRFIFHSSNPDDLIVDPFAGSGSFLLAATQAGRKNAEGCDLSIESLGIAKERGCIIIGN
jgi:site-specific DNA-methyltransferase (adenine-specific)